ncbi:DUF5672 family protein [Flavitalea sp.]|nr:DUF5672 family protein [Flavitalea sp.]
MKHSKVILIIVHKSEPSDFELNSLAQCYKILGKHPIKLIAPAGLDMANYKRVNSNIEVDFIDPRWQSNYAMFNRLKILPFIYKRYRVFDYILFYELDAWVFRDELDYWCDQAFDYIGAPWFEGWQHATENSPFIGIGNGGFSLRKVSSHLKVLNTFSYIIPIKTLGSNFLKNPGFKELITLAKRLTIANNTYHIFNTFSENEDYFWGSFIAKKFQWFHVPDLNTALRFSVEINPHLFIKTMGDLPFGCHGWYKYNVDFWRNYIQLSFVDKIFPNEEVIQ